MFNNLLENFLTYLKTERYASDNTIKSYNYDLIAFLKFLKTLAIIDINDVVLPNIYAYITSLKQKGDLNNSIRRKISSIKTFFSFLVIDEYIEEEKDPTRFMEGPKVIKKRPNFLKLQEINSIIDCIDTSGLMGLRNAAMIELLYASGVRVSELCNLKLHDINFETRCLKISPGKNRNERLVPMNNIAKKRMSDYLTSERDMLLFGKKNAYFFVTNKGKKMYRRRVLFLLKELAQRIGLQKKFSCHSFRHSFATHLLENGADILVISTILGHENISTTGMYLHPSKNHLKGIVDKCHPRYKE